MSSTNQERIKYLLEYRIPKFWILPPNILIDYQAGFGDNKHWHFLVDLIPKNIRNAEKAYVNGLLEACIYYAITTLEYALKAKYCLQLNEEKKDADIFLKEHHTLGSLCTNNPSIIDQLKLTELKENIIQLNELRNGLFHFNYEKLKEGIRKLGFDFSKIETNTSFIIYPNLIDDQLASNVYNQVINILEFIFKPKKSND